DDAARRLCCEPPEQAGARLPQDRRPQLAVVQRLAIVATGDRARGVFGHHQLPSRRSHPVIGGDGGLPAEVARFAGPCHDGRALNLRPLMLDILRWLGRRFNRPTSLPSGPRPDGALMETLPEPEYGGGANGFALAMFGQLRRESGNLLFSPFSVRAA